ncbi:MULTISPECIES: methyltransferase domain-containing protein [unclassified Kaistella]|uniref:methyltransferase n=1 Tax=unclassified Kaistella TaxID=2762626 RepID=UPI002732941C|nr:MULTISPECIES: methyltransferase domain-containing protein [unclassified Kaistella]MDP2452810.1 methyltransferase domain-containing protein [Kaistella sp. SH11-4b]MDP2455719.1 methyltransferase domain-containing protein [Kaistella sp. SH40-3]MDP2458623.1 methyltransferase domain-containing protein [Kaistella sp. SH19-2b]
MKENSSDQNNLGKNYWDERWETRQTGWDIGYSSPAIEEYVLQYQNKEAGILIPGCGNAYEVEFLWNLGFKNITVLDISSKAVEILKEKYKDREGVTVICEDFFKHHGNYDLIIEQTFFCAINPNLRTQYAEKMHELLDENGKIIGVMFNKTFEKAEPPFGGSIPEI